MTISRELEDLRLSKKLRHSGHGRCSYGNVEFDNSVEQSVSVVDHGGEVIAHVSSVVRAAKYSVSALWMRMPAYISLAILTAHALHGMVRNSCPNNCLTIEIDGHNALTQDLIKTQRVVRSSVVVEA